MLIYQRVYITIMPSSYTATATCFVLQGPRRDRSPTRPFHLSTVPSEDLRLDRWWSMPKHVRPVQGRSKGTWLVVEPTPLNMA